MTDSARQRARALAAEVNELARVGLLDEATLTHLRKDALDCILALDHDGALAEPSLPKDQPAQSV